MNRFQSWYRVQPRALRALLTINVVVYVLWQVVFIHPDVTRYFVYKHLALNPALPGILFEPWQLITYNFLHLQPGFSGLIHILFNMLWLVWIGREYEEMHGPHRLMAVYLIAGVGGGLLTVLLHALLPEVAAFGGPVHGASASVIGMITTVAILYPYKTISLFLLGSFRLIYLVIGLLVLDLLFLAGGGTSVSAHMGGVLFGFLFAKGEGQGTDLSSWARVFFPERRAARSRQRSGDESILEQLEMWLAGRRPKKQEESREQRQTVRVHTMHKNKEPEVTKVDPIENEIDRILDKISARGYDALTDEEKRTLDEASRS